MKHIPTTHSAVNRMKALAKKLSRQANVGYMAALERVALREGYESYHHVTVCLANSSTAQEFSQPMDEPAKTPHEISFEVPGRYHEIIRKIALRADQEIFSLYPEIRQSIMATEMDLSACYAQGCELDFERLLSAPLGDFQHDILGIRRHLNRETGYLEDFFLPRYAKVQY